MSNESAMCQNDFRSYFSVNCIAKIENALYFIIMYQSEINYGIYTSYKCILSNSRTFRLIILFLHYVFLLKMLPFN